MSNHNRGLSIDTSYQVSVHLAKRSIKHGRCLFSNLKISEKKSVKNRKLLKKLDSSPLKPFGQMN
jgi:hypothetical protein